MIALRCVCDKQSHVCNDFFSLFAKQLKDGGSCLLLQAAKVIFPLQL